MFQYSGYSRVRLSGGSDLAALVLPLGSWLRRLTRLRSSDFIHFAGNALAETIFVKVKVIAALDKLHGSIAAQSLKRVAQQVYCFIKVKCVRSAYDDVKLAMQFWPQLRVLLY
jgi:hypothetical protein